MRVTVTFECNNVAEAIQLLGKNLEDGPVVATVVNRAAEPAAPSATPAEAPAPQPGEKRGPGRPKSPTSRRSRAEHKDAPEPTPVSGPSPATAPVPAAPTPAPEQPTPSNEQLVAAMQAVLDSKGMDAVMAVLTRHGVAKASLLFPEQRAGFVDYCAKVVSGEIDPNKG